MSIKITVGLVIRNCENTINDTIDGIIQQDFPHDQMEIIFIVGKSKDNTLQIVKNFCKNTAIQTKILEEDDKGLGAARNMVVRNSQAEYIVWVDSDIVLFKDHIKMQAEFMDKNSNVGIAKGKVMILKNEKPVLYLELIPYMLELLRIKEWKNPKRLPGTGAATYRVEAIKNVGGFDEKIRGVGEDQDAAFKILQSGWSICRTDAKFYESHQGMKNLKDLWKMYSWRGRTSYSIYKNNKHFFTLIGMTPPAGFLGGLLCTRPAYELLRNKVVFLLPFHYAFKMMAWFSGFYVSSRIE